MSSTFCASIALRSRRSVVLVEQRAEGQHLAEHRGRLGERQRRRGHQRALAAGQHLVHAMAELVRQRHHVARLAHVVQQHIGMRRRHGRMREGARRLAGPHRRVDPVAVEEGARDLGHVRREAVIGRQHGVLRLVPADRRLRRLGQRRVAVPVVHRFHAEPARLHRVVAVRQPRIGLANGGGQRIHDARARRGWRGGGNRRCPGSRASGRRFPCPWPACW